MPVSGLVVVGPTPRQFQLIIPAVCFVGWESKESRFGSVLEGGGSRSRKSAISHGFLFRLCLI